MIETDGEHEVVADVASGMEAIKASEKLRPDLCLLDIRMPGMDGIETAQHFMTLAVAPAVIFCTAFEEHAVQAFELQAVGYLLKPVRRADLFRALAKSARLNRIQLDAVKNVKTDRRTHLCARTYKGVELVNISDIRYLKADQKYVSVRYTGGEVIVDETLRELEEEFPDLFSRVHRNALVTTNHIMGLEKDAKGQIGVRMSDVEELIDVSRRHLPAIRKVIRRL
jgi:two-component system response regulator AlgR